MHQVGVPTVLGFAVGGCKCAALHAGVFGQPGQATRYNPPGWGVVCPNPGPPQLVLAILAPGPNVLVLNGPQRYW